MKPNFALKLSFDSVVLLHRVQHGWLAIGEARLDAPELDETLGQLRDTARQLEPHGLITKLILPEDEVLYRVIEAPGPGFEQRRAQIAAELEGYTPYRLDELIFDWSGQGRRVQVAVVAREMFDQAEEFAHKHGFNPVSVVTQPEPGSFEGEPFFGMTRVGHDILPRGIKVTPDTEPVRITGRAGDSAEEAGAQVASRLATAAAATGGAAPGRAAT
ncbi:translation initiation factor 2, partial [Rhodobacteraceae bacterium WD3A24]